MAAAVDEFSIWLGSKLQALNTDENVFGSYITGILDGDETLEEKIEALEGILSEIVVSTFIFEIEYFGTILLILSNFFYIICIKLQFILQYNVI